MPLPAIYNFGKKIEILLSPENVITTNLSPICNFSNSIKNNIYDYSIQSYGIVQSNHTPIYNSDPIKKDTFNKCSGVFNVNKAKNNEKQQHKLHQQDIKPHESSRSNYYTFNVNASTSNYKEPSTFSKMQSTSWGNSTINQDNITNQCKPQSSIPNFGFPSLAPKIPPSNNKDTSIGSSSCKFPVKMETSDTPASFEFPQPIATTSSSQPNYFSYLKPTGGETSNIFETMISNNQLQNISLKTELANANTMGSNKVKFETHPLFESKINPSLLSLDTVVKGNIESDQSCSGKNKINYSTFAKIILKDLEEQNKLINNNNFFNVIISYLRFKNDSGDYFFHEEILISKWSNVLEQNVSDVNEFLNGENILYMDSWVLDLRTKDLVATLIHLVIWDTFFKIDSKKYQILPRFSTGVYLKYKWLLPPLDWHVNKLEKDFYKIFVPIATKHGVGNRKPIKEIYKHAHVMFDGLKCLWLNALSPFIANTYWTIDQENNLTGCKNFDISLFIENEASFFALGLFHTLSTCMSKYEKLFMGIILGYSEEKLQQLKAETAENAISGRDEKNFDSEAELLAAYSKIPLIGWVLLIYVNAFYRIYPFYYNLLVNEDRNFKDIIKDAPVDWLFERYGIDPTSLEAIKMAMGAFMKRIYLYSAGKKNFFDLSTARQLMLNMFFSLGNIRLQVAASECLAHEKMIWDGVRKKLGTYSLDYINFQSFSKFSIFYENYQHYKPGAVQEKEMLLLPSNINRVQTFLRAISKFDMRDQKLPKDETDPLNIYGRYSREFLSNLFQGLENNFENDKDYCYKLHVKGYLVNKNHEQIQSLYKENIIKYEQQESVKAKREEKERVHNLYHRK